METGFVLINVRASYEKHVYNKLKHLANISEVHPLFGEYDFIVKIKIENFNRMGEYIINDIRTIDGIIKTKSLTKTKF